MKITFTHNAYKSKEGNQQVPPALTHALGCRNEKVAVQLFFQEERGVLTHSRESLLLPDLTLPIYRVVLSCEELKVTSYLETYLPDDNGVLQADRLANDPYITFSENLPGVLWIDVEIPQTFSKKEVTLTAKIYTKTAFQDEVLVENKSIQIEILPYTLPKPQDYTLFLDLWQHSSNVARQYQVPLWSDDHFNRLEEVVASLAQLGQKSVMIVASDCPWCGWGTHIGSKDGTSFYEFSMLHLIKQENGEFICDFTTMQRYIDLCAHYNIDADISLYGLLGVWEMDGFPSISITDYPERISVRYYDEATQTYLYVRNREEYIKYLQLIFEYFKKTGQFEKLYLATDEPKISDPVKAKQFREVLDILFSIEPNIQLKMAVDQDDVIKEYVEKTKVLAMSFPCTVSHPDIAKQYPDKRILWYVCNIPDKPNTLFKNHLLEARILGTLNSLFDLSGFLRWAYTAWTIEPRQDIRYETKGFPTGDFSLTYPSKNGKIEVSLRLKQLEMGIIDFELLAKLKKAGAHSVVEEAYQILQLDEAYTTFMATKKETREGLYSLDYLDYQKFRRFIVDALIQLEKQKS